MAKSSPDHSRLIAIYRDQIELLVDNYPNCPRWASAEVDRLTFEIERLIQLNEVTTPDLSH